MERPRRFAEMVGHERTLNVLCAVLGAEVPPNNFLLYGEFGSGKSTAARIIAAMLNCTESSNLDACGICESCQSIAEGRSDALVEIDAAVHGKTENIRTIKELAEYASPHTYRVLILDECHAMHPQAFNALLKTMEEVPSNTVFVLVTTRVDKVPDTVRSRALPFHFAPVPAEAVVPYLMRGLSDDSYDAEGLQLVAQRSPSVRDAAKNAQLIHQVFGGVHLAEVEQFFGSAAQSRALMVAVLEGRSWTEEFVEYLNAGYTPADLCDYLLTTLENFYRAHHLTASEYRRGVEIAWSLLEDVEFNTRGRIRARAALAQLEVIFGKERG